MTSTFRGRQPLVGACIALSAAAVVLGASLNARHHFLATRPGPRTVVFQQLQREFQGVAARVEPAGRVRVSRLGRVEISGWALDVDARAPLAAAYVMVDDALPFAAAYGLESRQAARRFGCCPRSGFRAVLRGTDFLPGPHRIVIRFIRPDLTHYVDSRPIVVDVGD